jgi:hypothetical protein
MPESGSHCPTCGAVLRMTELPTDDTPTMPTESRVVGQVLTVCDATVDPPVIMRYPPDDAESRMESAS